MDDEITGLSIRLLIMNICRINIILSIILLIGPGVLSQEIIDSFRVCSLPIRDGVIYEYKRYSVYDRGDNGVTILTKCDSVFHIGAGKVLAVHKYDQEEGIYMVVLENGKNEFISYSNLKYVAIKKGDVVEKGTWLGLTAISDEGNEKQLDFMILKM